MNEEDYSEFSRAINRLQKEEPITRKRDFLKRSMTNIYGSLKNLAISEQKEVKEIKNRIIFLDFFLIFERIND